MNRSERLNHMMLYLSDKTTFNLKDLMHMFEISKSTALRDILALESLGYPIYSTHGKYGKYHILHHKMTYHLEFTNEELYALAFASTTLRNYQSTPFHIDAKALIRKFELTLPQQTRERLEAFQKTLHLDSPHHHTESPFLKDLLLAAVDHTLVDFVYRDKKRTCIILFITTRFGQWYVTVYDCNTTSFKVLRCDRIQALTPSKRKVDIDTDAVLKAYQIQTTDTRPFVFEMQCGPESIDLFYKEAYPTMKLHINNECVTISGSYYEHEEPFILRYLATYGHSIQALSPPPLQLKLARHFKALHDHISTL